MPQPIHFLTLLTALVGLNASGAPMDLRQVFIRPLIIGASVSAGFMTDGPGTRAAERYTPPSNILNVAKFGAPAREQIQRLTPENLEGRSIIIGVDFLFWDSWTTPDNVYARNVAASERALQQLIATAHNRHLPLILGDIPATNMTTFNPADGSANDRGTSTQSARLELNNDIHHWCEAKDGCYLLELSDFAERADTSQGVQINGQRRGLSDLTTDGFHLKASTSEYLADRIVQLLDPGAPLLRRSGPPESDLGFGDEIKYLLNRLRN